MANVVLYDACVLYPAPLRDLLIRLTVAGLVQAKWTDRILDECFLSVAAQRPELSAVRLQRTRALMIAAVRDCLVTDYELLMEGLALPDPNDCHVVAAAIRAGAQAIITANLKDFPTVALAPYGIDALHPDAFVMDLIDRAPNVVAQVVSEQAEALRNPTQTVDQLLETLHHNGLVRSVERLRDVLPSR